MMRNNICDILEKLIPRYAGKYVAVIADKVVASGASEWTVYKKAEKLVGKKSTIGLLYVPPKNAAPFLLRHS